MRVTPHLDISDLIIIEPVVHGDDRGRFLETFQAERYAEHGIPSTFVQDNLSYSTRGVLRGMHYQLGRPQGKLVSVVQGEVLDVAVDVRRGSPTFGRWAGVTLSSDDCRQFYVPEGFAHGFFALSETVAFAYKCTDYYNPKAERGVRWDSPTVGITWPAVDPMMSPKDQAYPVLADMPDEDLPVYVG